MGSCTADEGFAPAMEDLHPLLHNGRFNLLYAASILGWVNGCIGSSLPRLVFQLPIRICGWGFFVGIPTMQR